MKKLIMLEFIIIVALCCAIYRVSSLDSSDHDTVVSPKSVSAEDSEPQEVVLFAVQNSSPASTETPAQRRARRIIVVRKIQEMNDRVSNGDAYSDCLRSTTPNMSQICDPLRNCNDENCRGEDDRILNVPKVTGRKMTPAEESRNQRIEHINCILQTPSDMRALCGPENRPPQTSVPP